MRAHIEVTLDEQERTELMDELYESVGGAMLDRVIDIVMHQYELRVCAGCGEVISTLPGSREGVMLHAEARQIGAYCVECTPEGIRAESEWPYKGGMYTDLLSIVAWQAAKCEAGPAQLPDQPPNMFYEHGNSWRTIFSELPGLQEKFTDSLQTIRRHEEDDESE